jgi:hypothetical protein
MKQINVTLTKKEVHHLWSVLGEFRRISRDQYHRFVGTGYAYSESLHNKEMYDIACSLYKKLVETDKD